MIAGHAPLVKRLLLLVAGVLRFRLRAGAALQRAVRGDRLQRQDRRPRTAKADRDGFGVGGLVATAAVPSAVDRSRTVTVEFTGTVMPGLPWEMRPLTVSLETHPGEMQQVRYLVRNTSNRPVTGQAVPSVTPGQAALHFDKIECFCFSQQALAPGESKEMPLTFIVKPDIDKDIRHITLSYAFFSIDGQPMPRQRADHHNGGQAMTETMAAQPHSHHYHVPQPSLYPIILSGGMFTLALGFILKMNGFAPGPWIMLGGVGIILYVLFGWFGKVIGESQAGAYREWEDKSFRYGMVWFIASEVAFFAAFFGALFYMRDDLGARTRQHGVRPRHHAVARLHRRLALGRPQGRAIHADGRLGHPGHQHRPAAVIRRDGDLGALGAAQGQAHATQSRPRRHRRSRCALPRAASLRVLPRLPPNSA